ncbi:MAG: glycoside hydrolase family 3 N-terminal domain-containing protein, partial [Flavobacteriales bacterium]
STIAYPRQLTLAATQNDSLIYVFGVEMSRQLKRLGVHVSFSPVVDVNNNARNPVISNRSFGEDKLQVTQQALMYMQGLQDNGVMACAKHFPGHGDTDTDSHKDLPLISHDLARLDSIELYPYRALISKGLGSVMTAHLYVPALDSTPNVASTLSRKIINDLLRDSMHFGGLVFTDAMNMQGVAKFFKPGEIEVKALQAGNDVLLFSQNVPLAVQKIKEAIEAGLVSKEEIDAHCYRILQAKEWAGLDHFEQVKVADITNDLNNARAEELRIRLVEQCVTVLKNEESLLPLTNLTGKKIAVVNIGVTEKSEFENTLSHYFHFDSFYMDKNPDFKQSMWWRDTLSRYDIVIAGILNTSNKASKNFGVSNESARILNSAGEKTKVVLCVFANPYSIDVLKDLNNIEVLMTSYQDDIMTQKATAEAIAGVNGAKGRLPVSVCDDYLCYAGMNTTGGQRLKWIDTETKLFASYGRDIHDVSPQGGNAAGDYEEDMMGDQNKIYFKNLEGAFSRIDAIAQSGITKGAYPGCRVLVAKDGRVVYDKAFGTLDWKENEKVELNTVYDLASITKVASSTLAAMKLVDEGKLDVNKTLGDYLPIPAENEYSKVVIKNMLSHCAGFTPWIPFYSSTISDGKLDPSIYSQKQDSVYNERVCDGLYIRREYRDSIFQQIIRTPLGTERNYKYSDLGYYFIQRIVENATGKSIDEFVSQTYYGPMGLNSIGYKPLENIEKERIAPTEDDQTFRHQHIRGDVHDQGAAMMGGVAGHAGLFSTAQDLAVIMQMLNNGGEYGGQRYISKETIALFNTRHFAGNRRGLGFDKPSLTPGSGSTCRQASGTSFGHTGFTGTMCWADPDQNIVYVFLSNRVNPNAENKKLQDLNIRTEIQEEIYKAFEK